MVHRSEKKHQDNLKRQRKLADKTRRARGSGASAPSSNEIVKLASSGQTEQALVAARKLTQQTPTAWQAWNLLATIQDHLRRHEEAEASFREVTRLAPDRSEGWHGLGRVLCSRHSTGDALTCLHRASEIVGDDVAILRDLARTFLVAGNVEAAYDTIQHAKELSPLCPEVWNMVGMVAQQKEEIEEAAIAFCRAAELKPTLVDAWANLGECLRVLGDLEQAQQMLNRALELDPQHANALGFAGMLATMQGQRPRAIELLRAALAKNPRYRLFRLQLARTLAASGEVEESLENLRLLEERFGDQPDIMFERAGIHALLCQGEQSRPLLDKILHREPDNVLARVRRALMIPQIARDVQEIAETRRQIETALDECLASDLPSLPMPLDDFANTHFYLSYHGRNNVDINRKLSSLYRKLIPAANFVNPQLADLRRLEHPGSKIRLAFVSKNFSNHTIGRLNIGLVQGLDRRRFEVTTCVFPGTADAFQAKFQQASDHFLVLPGEPSSAAQVLADHQPDVIFYTDLGMDPTTYQMAHNRLAPIQFTAWGHPITTGITTVDYFVSSEGMDQESSQAHYSEKLVVLRNLLLNYARPALLSEQIDKSTLGLPNNIRLYLCPQTIFKLHPEFDAILGSILRADPSGLVMMIKLGQETWRQKLLARFAKTLPDVQDRILWMDRMSAMKYQHLFRLGDVALDPYRFGSGNTCLEALAMGTPLVTCPDPFMRTRMAVACYERMGVIGAVADSPEQYVERATQIAMNPDYRRHLSQEIRERAAVLFDNINAVRELEGWIESAVVHHAQQ
ncbi:MAG: tetratricopeptide repeat protein [Pirellulaceae bacterium]|nr:tetratricopeptide repeat protein [Pirellulaceae bacterium]